MSVRQEPVPETSGLCRFIDNVTNNPVSTGPCTATSTPTSTIAPSSSGSSAISTPQNAPASTTATTSSPPQKGTESHGLQAGPAAGLAIGMLLAGVLIAGAIFFFLLRRQKNRQQSSYAVNHLPPSTHTSGYEKAPVPIASAVPRSIDSFIPQPASDDTIKGDVSMIQDNIKNHVRTFYHSAALKSGINEGALRNIAMATGMSSSALASALSNPSTRQAALRLVVAWVILSKTTPGQDASLLPTEIAKLSATMIGSNVDTAMYSKWKSLTAALLQKQFGKNAQNPNRAFSNITVELDAIVAPYVQAGVDDGPRRKNLDMILTRSANLAFLLFSQPGSFHFDFTSRQGGLVAFPALSQTVSDEGQILQPHRVLFRGETVAT